MFVVETERLRLCELTASDSAFILELVNEPAWLQFIGDRGVRTIADAERYIETGPRAMYTRHGFGFWRVETKAEGLVVGACGLLKRDVLDTPDLGFAFLERHRRKGYAREAAVAALDAARGRFGLKRIIALTAPGNERSMKLLRSLEFRFDRVRPACSVFAESNVFVSEAPPDRIA